MRSTAHVGKAGAQILEFLYVWAKKLDEILTFILT